MLDADTLQATVHCDTALALHVEELDDAEDVMVDDWLVEDGPDVVAEVGSSGNSTRGG